MNNVPQKLQRIFIALAFVLMTPIAQAQPITTTNPQLSIAIVAGDDGTPLVTLNASQTSAATILSLISVKTGAKILVKKDAPIDDLDVKRVALTDAIAQVAQAANLKMVRENHDVEPTYIVGEIQMLPNIKSSARPFDMDFKEIPVAQLVKVIAEQFDIKAQVAPQTPQKIISVAAFNVTPIEALQIFAKAADLEVSKTADVYLLRERAKVESVRIQLNAVPAKDLLKILSQQFGVRIVVSNNLPDKWVDVSLGDMTPEQALQAIVKAADFEVDKVGEFYVVRERVATTK